MPCPSLILLLFYTLSFFSYPKVRRPNTLRIFNQRRFFFLLIFPAIFRKKSFRSERPERLPTSYSIAVKESDVFITLFPGCISRKNTTKKPKKGQPGKYSSKRPCLKHLSFIYCSFLPAKRQQAYSRWKMLEDKQPADRQDTTACTGLGGSQEKPQKSINIKSHPLMEG